MVFPEEVTFELLNLKLPGNKHKKEEEGAGSARLWLCLHSSRTLGSFVAPHCTLPDFRTTLQYVSAAHSQARPGVQQGPDQWQLDCLLTTGLWSPPHCGLAGGRYSGTPATSVVPQPRGQSPTCLASRA